MQRSARRQAGDSCNVQAVLQLSSIPAHGDHIFVFLHTLPSLTDSFFFLSYIFLSPFFSRYVFSIFLFISYFSSLNQVFFFSKFSVQQENFVRNQFQFDEKGLREAQHSLRMFMIKESFFHFSHFSRF